MVRSYPQRLLVHRRDLDVFRMCAAQGIFVDLASRRLDTMAFPTIAHVYVPVGMTRPICICKIFVIPCIRLRFTVILHHGFMISYLVLMYYKTVWVLLISISTLAHNSNG